ncbi:hypothetical protein E7T09_08170 [Deinococcus sp. KSM4-11]|uniref:hypothetical protein n=1 Tax=Deinococcus sp. KSM4-11 TaxID=2568654 RepID=UPI0010A50895|nr:hypothetical protein [Deinococcus sp. KSM4-11]THF87130.1 hypothetical protein E7T09_08170 [Deinococcus sp. KSM4-11]
MTWTDGEAVTDHRRARRRATWLLLWPLAGLAALIGALLLWPRIAPVPMDGLQVSRVCGEDVNCVGRELRRIVARTDPRTALRIATELVRQPAFASEGHPFAHEIGYATASKYATLGEQLQACGDTLGSGCYHGVLMLYIGRPENAHADLSAVCAGYRGQGPPAMYTDCVHGIGHGLMMRALMAAPGPGGWPQLREALRGCEGMRQAGETERFFCTGGVFMEYRVAATMKAFHYPTPPTYRSGDPAWPCTQVQGVERTACYSYQGTLIALRSRTAAAAFAVCAHAGGVAAQACASSISRDRVTGTLAVDRPYVQRLCPQAADPALRHTCYTDAARYYLYLNRDLPGALSMCAASGAREQSACEVVIRHDAEAEYQIGRAAPL